MYKALLGSAKSCLIKPVGVLVFHTKRVWVIPASPDFFVQHCRESGNILLTEYRDGPAPEDTYRICHEGRDNKGHKEVRMHDAQREA